MAGLLSGMFRSGSGNGRASGTSRDAKPALRFSIGTEVLCRTGGGWMAGRVVALNYRQPDFPPGYSAPYQVECENGSLIFVPQDLEQLCKRRVATWWEVLFLGFSPLYAFEQKRAKDASFGINDLRAACKGKDVNQSDHNGRTALVQSVLWQWPQGVQVLLEMKANPNLADGMRRTCLHVAMDAFDSDADFDSTLKLLLAAKANPNLHDKDPEKDEDFSSTSFEEREEHRTPLHYCAELGRIHGATMLLEARADANAIDAQYKTPLHLAIEEHGSGEMVNLLLRFKADPDKGNIEAGMNSSCLIEAARAGDLQLSRDLIAAGACVNKCGKQGMTALHMAVRGRHVDIAVLLIEAKCDTSIKAMGKTAGELASTNHVTALAKVLGFEEAPEKSSVTTLSDAQKKELYID